MIVLFLSCGVIYLKYYAVRIWVGVPGRVDCVPIQFSSSLLVTWDLGTRNNTQAVNRSILTFLVKPLTNLTVFSTSSAHFAHSSRLHIWDRAVV